MRITFLLNSNFQFDIQLNQSISSLNPNETPKKSRIKLVQSKSYFERCENLIYVLKLQSEIDFTLSNVKENQNVKK